MEIEPIQPPKEPLGWAGEPAGLLAAEGVLYEVLPGCSGDAYQSLLREANIHLHFLLERSKLSYFRDEVPFVSTQAFAVRVDAVTRTLRVLHTKPSLYEGNMERCRRMMKKIMRDAFLPLILHGVASWADFGLDDPFERRLTVREQ